MNNNNNKTRAFLKWAGGKYGLIDHIRTHLPAGNKLIEPFVGAGSVFLNTDYERYLLNDINPDLINLYENLRDAPEQYVEDAGKLFVAENNQPEVYYGLRKEFNETDDKHRKATLFLYLNRHGYNGLCRYNLSGFFNVPFGRYKRPYFPEKELYFFAEKAKRAIFTCECYTKTFSRARKGNVIYCDPPYAPISKTANFTQYAGNGFNLDDQEKLAQLAEHAIEKKSVTVLISNHDTQDTRRFYNAAQITKLKVSRSISQKGHKRQKVGELFALYHTNRK